MFCTECGEKNRNDRKFCTNCGKPLRDYTKPRENLLMPEDIEKAKTQVKVTNKVKLICNILYLILLALSALSFVLAFVFTNLKAVFIITGIVLIIIGLVILFVKKIKIKQTQNK